MNDIYTFDFAKLLPESLRADENFKAIAEVVAEQLHKNALYSEYAVIYARIDELPEEVLDVLAYDLHIEWYDADFSIEEKRRTIKQGVNVHRHKGTKYAIITALQALFNNVVVKEWFEYDADPYHFKVEINTDETVEQAKRDKVYAAIGQFKNVRSVLDSVEYKKQVVLNDVTTEAASTICTTHKIITTEVVRQ